MMVIHRQFLIVITSNLCLLLLFVCGIATHTSSRPWKNPGLSPAVGKPERQRGETQRRAPRTSEYLDRRSPFRITRECFSPTPPPPPAPRIKLLEQTSPPGRTIVVIFQPLCPKLQSEKDENMSQANYSATRVVVLVSFTVNSQIRLHSNKLTRIHRNSTLTPPPSASCVLIGFAEVPL